MDLIKYTKNDSWGEIKFVCENCDFTNLHFVYNENNIILSKFNNEITLNIDKYTQNSIKSIINDLPNNIDNLLITISKTIQTIFLEKIFTNLPFNLKIIKFIYDQYKLAEVKTMESNGKFNVLFGIKISFNCKVMINYDNLDYDIKYNDFANELEFGTDEQQYKIQYITNIPYIPLEFYFTSNH
jgi:hypothetical protein